MKVIWTDAALADLSRLYDFLAAKNRPAAVKAIQALVSAPELLVQHPRRGEVVEEYRPREVRRLLIGQYEIRYEIQESVIFMIRIWHTREAR